MNKLRFVGAFCLMMTYDDLGLISGDERFKIILIWVGFECKRVKDKVFSIEFCNICLKDNILRDEEISLYI